MRCQRWLAGPENGSMVRDQLAEPHVWQVTSGASALPFARRLQWLSRAAENSPVVPQFQHLKMPS